MRVCVCACVWRGLNAGFPVARRTTALPQHGGEACNVCKLTCWEVVLALVKGEEAVQREQEEDAALPTATAAAIATACARVCQGYDPA